jgi:2-keto-3-deoxy-L-rhamnonate aldolase RhmA
MRNAANFRQRLSEHKSCLGSVVSFSDATVTEALCSVMDFVWIDMEHSTLSLAAVQGHVMATNGSKTAALVRVRSNASERIKSVLDLGADGVIAPNITNAAEAQQLVAACLYPPAGFRGYGPRRPAGYGRRGGLEFCQQANQSVIIVAQIEHIDAVNHIEEILAVPGLTSVMIGAYDLSGSMGLMGQPRHAEVVRAAETVIAKAAKAGVFVGIGAGNNPDLALEWMEKGANWVLLADDFQFLLSAADQVCEKIRNRGK